MLFKVEMKVNIPADMAAETVAEIKAREKAYAQDLQRQGKWRHLWRISGSYANVSIFDVADNAELHELISSLPLFPYMDITVAPCADTRLLLMRTIANTKYRKQAANKGVNNSANKCCQPIRSLEQQNNSLRRSE